MEKKDRKRKHQKEKIKRRNNPKALHFSSFIRRKSFRKTE